MLTLVRKGAAIDHPSGQHDDWANAAAGALTLVNPEIGAEAEPGMLGFVGQQVERQFGIAQRKTVQSGKIVTVAVPFESTHIIVAGIAYMVKVDGTARTVDMIAAHALELLERPLSPFRSANRELLEQLQGRARLEGSAHTQLGPGIRVTDMLQAAADARPSVTSKMQQAHNARWALQ